MVMFGISSPCMPGDVYHVVMGEHDLSVQEGTEQVRDVLHILVHADWDIHMVAAGEYPTDRPRKCQRLPQTLYKIC